MRYKFIDRIISVNSEEGSIKALKNLSLNEDIFEDHFKNHPMLPAAMMTEAAVELARYFVWLMSDYRLTGLPRNLQKFKFYKTTEPGDQIVFTAVFEKANGSLTNNQEISVKILATVDEARLFEGAFTIVLLAFDKLHDLQAAKTAVGILLREWSSL